MCPDERGIMSIKLSKDIELESCFVTSDVTIKFEFPGRRPAKEA